MKVFSFLLSCVLLTVSVKAQTTRFIYDTYVNPDSINLVTMKQELTYLDVKDGKSFFTSEKLLKSDSLLQTYRKELPIVKEDRKKKKEDAEFYARIEKDKKRSFFPFYIMKDLKNGVSTYHEAFFGHEIQYPEDRKLDWKLTEETSKIAGYNASKATVNFGGREWTAWYAPEIAIPDGPYKFFGLPGLILRLEDGKGDYKFELLRKIVVQSPYTFVPKPDALVSSHKKLNSDKAALLLVMKTQRKETQPDTDAGAREHKGKPPGGMHRGGDPGGDSPDGEMPQNTEPAKENGTNIMDQSSQNPIELKND